MLLRRLWTRRADLSFWSAWLAGGAAFIALAIAASKRYYLPGDAWLAERIQDLDRFDWAERLFDTANGFGNFDVIAGLLLVSFVVLLLRGLRFEALMIAGAGLLHYAQLGIRSVVERPFSLNAPPWVVEKFDLRQWPDAHSFPSGHVVGEAAVYGLIFAFIPRVIPFRPIVSAVRALCVAEIALGSVARVYVGAHWPSDVLGALMLAGLYLALVWRADRAVTRIRTVSAERALAEDAGLSAGAAAMSVPRRSVRVLPTGRHDAEPAARK